MFKSDLSRFDLIRKGCKMVYTTQRDRHWNMIVCKGDRERDGYRIIYTGSYNACLAVKANGGAI